MDSSLFINAEYEVLLRQDGAVKIPFLLPEELEEVKQFYNSLHGQADPPAMYDGIHMTIWCADIEYKLNVKQVLNEIFAAACNRTFKDYRAVGPQFIVKRQGKHTTFPVHQDWSVVDENKYYSFNLWVPLQDVNANNGAMWIIKGSHRIQRKVRGAGCLFPNYIPVLDKLGPYMTNYPMKAGEALLFYHNTIHGSPANVTADTRAVVQISVLPHDAPFHIYFQKEPGAQLEVYRPSDDFTYYYGRLREDSEMAPPDKQAIQVLPSYTNKPVTLDEIIEAIHG